MKLKRVTALLMMISMIAGVTACSAKKEPPVSETAGMESAADDDGEALLWDIEPLDSPVTLRIGYHTASTMHTPTYIAEQKGWLKDLNIEVETISQWARAYGGVRFLGLCGYRFWWCYQWSAPA